MGDMLAAICARGNQFRFTAMGASMSPVICSGDVLIINPVTNDIDLGDIVACITPGVNNLLVHRVVGKRGCCFLLKGDNVWHNDGYCGKNSIHGCVKEVLFEGKESNIFHKTVWAVCSRNKFFKKIFALASRFNILTFVCRVANRLT